MDALFNPGHRGPCFIIAEIGQNHNGSLEEAKLLMRLAKEAGTDCVKLQKTSLEDRFTPGALAKPYNGPNSFGATYGEHRKFLEFSREEFIELKEYAETLGMVFTASPMDLASLDFLLKLGLKVLKIGSGDANNLQLIEKAATSGVPIILSTGMQTLEEVVKSVKVIQKYHNRLAILHCVSAYPTPLTDVNLRVIEVYRNLFPNNPIGYSGHEEGPFIAIGAVALGAQIIEKHITRDRGNKGTDHKCSLKVPQEFRIMVDGIRSVEAALGSPEKRIQQSEMECKLKLGKSIVARRDLTPMMPLKENDFAIKVSHPKGLDPLEIERIVGKTLKNGLKKDDLVTLENIY